MTRGSDEAVAAAYFYRCPVCPRRQAPGPARTLSLHDDVKDFGDCLGYDLFALADIRGTNQSFLNQVGLAAGFKIATPVDSKRPDVIMEATMDTWLQGFGIPETNRTDGGEEFEKEFSDLMNELGMKPNRSPSCAPTLSAPIERAGGAWKYVAKAVIDQTNLVYDKPWKAKWLCITVTWARNSEPDESGYSPAHWVLGCGLKIPYDALSPASRLAVMSRAGDKDFALRLNMMQQAMRASRALRLSRGLHESLSKRSRGLGTLPLNLVLNVGDQVMFWRGEKTAKSAWAERWQGPALVVGLHQGTVYLDYKSQTVRAAPRHVRHATPEEMLPWYSIFADAYATDMGNPSVLTPDEERPKDDNAMAIEDQAPTRSENLAPTRRSWISPTARGLEQRHLRRAQDLGSPCGRAAALSSLRLRQRRRRQHLPQSDRSDRGRAHLARLLMAE